jgi:hypothetical protein
MYSTEQRRTIVFPDFLIIRSHRSLFSLTDFVLHPSVFLSKSIKCNYTGGASAFLF